MSTERAAARYVDLAARHGEALAVRGSLWALLARKAGRSEAFIDMVLADARARWELEADRFVPPVASRRGRPLGAQTADANLLGARWQGPALGLDWVQAARGALTAIYGHAHIEELPRNPTRSPARATRRPFEPRTEEIGAAS